MDINELARQLMFTIAPLIASGALTKIGEDTTDATRDLVQRAWSLLKQRFQGNPRAEATLTLYESEPQDTALQQRMQQQIVACFQEHQQALAELAALVQQLQAVQGSPQVAPTRQVYAYDQSQIGTVVQGDLQGDVNIGPTTFDNRVQGDKVQGNKISGNITTGTISGTGIVIGHGSQLHTRPHDLNTDKNNQ